MGANHMVKLHAIVNILCPLMDSLPIAAKAHLEGFGSVEGVKKGKGELFDYLRSTNNGTAFVMWDYDYLQEMSKGISGIIKYGTKDASYNR